MSSVEIKKLNGLDNWLSIMGMKISLKLRKKPIDDKWIAKRIATSWRMYTTFDIMLSMVGKKRCSCCNGFGFQDK